MFSAIIHAKCKLDLLGTISGRETYSGTSTDYTSRGGLTYAYSHGSTTGETISRGGTGTDAFTVTEKSTSGYGFVVGAQYYTASYAVDQVYAGTQDDYHYTTPESDATWSLSSPVTFVTTGNRTAVGTSSFTVGETLKTEISYTYADIYRYTSGAGSDAFETYGDTIRTATATAVTSRIRGRYATEKVIIGIDQSGAPLYVTSVSSTAFPESMSCNTVSSFSSTLDINEDLIEDTVLLEDNDLEGFYLAIMRAGRGHSMNAFQHISRNFTIRRALYFSNTVASRAIGGLDGTTADNSTFTLSRTSTAQSLEADSTIKWANQQLIGSRNPQIDGNQSFSKWVTTQITEETVSGGNDYSYGTVQRTILAADTTGTGTWIGAIDTYGNRRIMRSGSIAGSSITPPVRVSTAGISRATGSFRTTVVTIEDHGSHLPLGTWQGVGTFSDGGATDEYGGMSFAPPRVYSEYDSGLILTPRGAQGFAPIGIKKLPDVVYQDMKASFVSADFQFNDITLGVPEWVFSQNGTTGRMIPIIRPGWSDGAMAHITAFLTDEPFVIPVLKSYEILSTVGFGTATSRVSYKRNSVVTWMNGEFLSAEVSDSDRAEANIYGFPATLTSKEGNSIVSYTSAASAKVKFMLEQIVATDEITGWTTEDSDGIRFLGGNGYAQPASVQLVYPGIYLRTTVGESGSGSYSTQIAQTFLGSRSEKNLVAEKREPIYSGGFGASLYQESYPS